jgi:fatty-acyl-CoA synthase
MLTHYNIINNGYYIGECQKFTEKERLCLPVPLFHCFGIVLGVMALLSHGGTLVLIESFDPLIVLASSQREKCTALYGVPTMFIAVLSHPMFDMFDLTSLRTGIMAGSPCPMDVMKKVIGKMNMSEVTIAYGLTEASPVMTQTKTDDPVEKKVGTVGRELENIEVKVINPETGEECPPDVQGELCCRGYNVMKGYYRMPDETANVIDRDGWLHSGDLGLKDKDGFFKVTGRIKDMIIRGGENIYPREIEEYLYQMEGIKDVQVAGISDSRYGEVAGAFVIRKENSNISEEDVVDFCRGQISRFKIPQYVFFVDSYPMTGSGKIQKYKLREMGDELVKNRAEIT